MSSAAYLMASDEPIGRDEWLSFCRQHGIRYSPNTVGQNVFYVGAIEITFGEYGTISKLPDGRPDFANARPPEHASRITVSTFYGGNVEGVAIMACLIWLRWDTSMSADPEVQWAIMRGVADAVQRRIKDEESIVDGEVVLTVRALAGSKEPGDG